MKANNKEEEELNRKKLELEINRIQIETNQLKRRWTHPNTILSFIILIIGGYSALFLTRLTDIKNERLLLEKESLKHEISLFEQKRNSITKSVDSIHNVAVLLNDSVFKLNNKIDFLNKRLFENNAMISQLINELAKCKNSDTSNRLKDELKNIRDRNPSVLSLSISPTTLQKGVLDLQLNNNFVNDSTNIKIINYTGKVVFEKNTIGAKRIQIPFPEAGFYIIIIQNLKTKEIVASKFMSN